jgi:hypothetical protein
MCTITGILYHSNQEADEHGCLANRGNQNQFYRDNFTLTLIEGPCEGRGHCLADCQNGGIDNKLIIKEIFLLTNVLSTCLRGQYEKKSFSSISCK